MKRGIEYRIRKGNFNNVLLYDNWCVSSIVTHKNGLRPLLMSSGVNVDPRLFVLVVKKK